MVSLNRQYWDLKIHRRTQPELFSLPHSFPSISHFIGYWNQIEAVLFLAVMTTRTDGFPSLLFSQRMEQLLPTVCSHRMTYWNNAARTFTTTGANTTISRTFKRIPAAFVAGTGINTYIQTAATRSIGCDSWCYALLVTYQWRFPVSHYAGVFTRPVQIKSKLDPLYTTYVHADLKSALS